MTESKEPLEKVFCFDCDGVICFTKGTDYAKSKPNYGVIKKINSLYDLGHTIKVFTGRGSQSGLDWRATTEFQLKEWGVKYHELIMGKPSYDFFIDDHAWNIKDWLNEKIP